MLKIAEKVVDKIFQSPSVPARQPDKFILAGAGFFTTKPTGEACPTASFRRGTGLGLSLSYDIVKAHGGELKVETKPARAGTDGEGGGSTFTIILPITNA